MTETLQETLSNYYKKLAEVRSISSLSFEGKIMIIKGLLKHYLDEEMKIRNVTSLNILPPDEKVAIIENSLKPIIHNEVSIRTYSGYMVLQFYIDLHHEDIMQLTYKYEQDFVSFILNQTLKSIQSII